jgi:hypothetical protein
MSLTELPVAGFELPILRLYSVYEQVGIVPKSVEKGLASQTRTNQGLDL